MDNLIPILVAVVATAGSIAAYSSLTKNKKKNEPVESNKEVPVKATMEESAPVVTSKELARQTAVIEAQAKAKEIVLDAKNKALDITQQAQKEVTATKNKVVEETQKLTVEKAQLNTQKQQFDVDRKSIAASKEQVNKKRQDLDGLVSEQQDKLQRIAGLSKKQARKELLDSFENELVSDKGKMLRNVEDEIKREADEKAREILVYAMKQGATDYVVEHSSSKVKLPEEDMKGRIIGKEGRNIKKFEELTGVELELDESPGEVIVSSFDPVRREVAKVALEKLLADGRIQPAKIEEIVTKTQAEIDKVVFKEGDNLCHRLGVYNLPRDVVQALGRFKYRYSYGQNMIEHTLEVAKIGMAIAAEIGANIEVVKLGCLLHDIGKVLEGDGSHVGLGVAFLKKHKVKHKVIECVDQHHEDKPFTSVEAVITHVADHVSGARPSARSEDYESYVKRLTDLEEAAYSFDGVDKVHAISAGREIRAFVRPEAVDDDSTALLAREIARKIELEQSYPGVVKVTVIRETRFSETAK